MAKNVGMGGGYGQARMNKGPKSRPRPNRPPAPRKSQPRPPGKRPPTGKRPGVGKPKPKPSVGFDAEKMARTLTDLGYDSQINAIQRAIDENNRMEMQAMANLTDWTQQVEDQRARGAGSIADVWNQAIAGNAASDQNIANLFGESAKGDALKAMDPGADMLQAMAGSNQAFMQYMAPILQAQGMDYKARARGEFAGDRRDLTGQLLDTRREKTQAYGKNLLDAMQLGWGREEQLFNQQQARIQARQAQQALNQSAKMFGPELEAQKLQNQATAQSIRLNEVNAIEDQKLSKIQRQQAILANRKAQKELQLMESQGVDLLDPQASAQVAGAALAGTVNQNGVLMMNPRLALRNALDILTSLGLGDSPEAYQAVMFQFRALLRKAHAKGAYRKWSFNKSGELVYNPGGAKNTGTPVGPH